MKLNLTQLQSDTNHALETQDYFEIHDALVDNLELIKQYQQLKVREKSVSRVSLADLTRDPEDFEGID